MEGQPERAESFRRLHTQSSVLVLPNAWDVPSARVFENAGFPAVATSSAGVMVSRGYEDGESMPFREYLETVERISRVLAVPLSADVVAGYGAGPSAVARSIRKVLGAGAIGINIEDHRPDGEGLYPVRAQVAKIRAIRATGAEAGVPLVINARTDALWKTTGTPEEQMREAIARSVAYRDAGADCVYPMRLTNASDIDRFVRALQCPVNVMVRPGLPSVPELAHLGVKRVSFGPAASYAAMGLLKRASEEVLTRGTFHALTDGAIAFEELNELARPRGPPPSSSPT